MNLPLFKIRASAIGKIMTNPRSKSEALSETAKSYCQEWLKKVIYKREKELRSKYIEKGNFVEDWSVDFLNVLFVENYEKNTEYKENDYITGTCDIDDEIGDAVIDIKNSWNLDTFPRFKAKIPNKDYEWQLLGYMDLWGRGKGFVDYTLMDAPHHIIEREARSLMYSYNMSEDEAWEKASYNLTFNDIPNHLRHKRFEVKRDDEKIKAIYERVEFCRDYIESITQGE